MDEDIKKRKILDELTQKKVNVYKVAIKFPECACESTPAIEGGNGRVENDETLRYFVTTNSDIKLKSNILNGKITAAIFSRIFKYGMSTIRLKHASASEISSTAEKLHAHQVSVNEDFGGVVGVVDFKANLVRCQIETNERLCCVLDTPIEESPSHADVVSRKYDCESDDGEKLRIKQALFKSIGNEKAFTKFDNIQDFDIEKFLPKALKN